MARLKLNPDPTFKAKVAVPVPGGSADIECTFKYRDRDQMKAWIDETAESADVDVLMDSLVAWDLEDTFDRDNVERLCTKFPGAAREIVHRYLRELSGIRQGN
ncbi:MAG TPA: phage tail assembly chaperone [Lysobacter sp.]